MAQITFHAYIQVALYDCCDARTVIHKYIHTYSHTCIHTYIQVALYYCRSPTSLPDGHTYIHIYIFTYIHTYRWRSITVAIPHQCQTDFSRYAAVSFIIQKRLVASMLLRQIECSECRHQVFYVCVCIHCVCLCPLFRKDLLLRCYYAE